MTYWATVNEWRNFYTNRTGVLPCVFHFCTHLEGAHTAYMTWLQHWQVSSICLNLHTRHTLVSSFNTLVSKFKCLLNHALRLVSPSLLPRRRRGCRSIVPCRSCWCLRRSSSRGCTKTSTYECTWKSIKSNKNVSIDHPRHCRQPSKKKYKNTRIHSTFKVIQACLFVLLSVLKVPQRVPPTCTTQMSRTGWTTRKKTKTQTPCPFASRT